MEEEKNLSKLLTKHFKNIPAKKGKELENEADFIDFTIHKIKCPINYGSIY